LAGLGELNRRLTAHGATRRLRDRAGSLSAQVQQGRRPFGRAACHRGWPKFGGLNRTNAPRRWR